MINIVSNHICCNQDSLQNKLKLWILPGSAAFAQQWSNKYEKTTRPKFMQNPVYERNQDDHKQSSRNIFTTIDAYHK